MPVILLHSSKTMRAHPDNAQYQPPALLNKAKELAVYVQSLSQKQLMTCMGLSDTKAAQTYALMQSWTTNKAQQTPAIDTFIGDIYSGLQVSTFSDADRAYANRHLFILSGLYGMLRALDSISPYRLEMGYKLPDEPYRNLYSFWGDTIAAQLPSHQVIYNLSAVEYTKAVLPYVPNAKVVTPKFMTLDTKGAPVFVVVHAKIARGAFARWLIKSRAGDDADITKFSDLNYRYNYNLSTPDQPVFVCEEFGGLGMSVRLTQR